MYISKKVLKESFKISKAMTFIFCGICLVSAGLRAVSDIADEIVEEGE